MTTAAGSRPGRFARLLDGGWSTGLFVLGCLWDICAVMNVPGAAEFRAGAQREVSITDTGTLLVLAAIIAWATVFARARHPQLVLIAGGALMILGVSYALALVGVFHALLRWPRRASLIGGIAVAAVALFVLRESLTEWGAALPWLFSADGGSPGGPAWDIARWVIAALALCAVGGLVVHQRTRAEAAANRVRAAREHERADALGEQLARQAERERIARDLHDGLGYRLSTAALSASAFEAQVAADPAIDPSLAGWARTVRQQTHAALEDVRGVVGGLRSEPAEAPPAPRASLRLIAPLLTDLRAGGSRIDAYVRIEGADRVAPALDAAVYRIVQESLTNALKHAPGEPISLTVDAAPDRGVRVRIENPLAARGAGVPSGGQGIVGIRERAAVAGGSAWIGPHEGRFIVDVSLPWAERA